MSNDNARLFDDLTRVAGGAVSVLSALGKQMQAGLQDKMGQSFGAPSNRAEDVERLQGVVTKLRMEQESLKERIAALESLAGIKKKVSSTKTNARTAPKKPAAKKAASKSPKPSAKKSTRK